MTFSRGIAFQMAYLVAVMTLASLSTTFAQQQCLPDCAAGQTAPLYGGPDCMCTTNVHPAGCTVSPCKAGDQNTNSTYTCQCTPDQTPEECVSMRCNTVETGAGSGWSAAATPNCGGNLCLCQIQPPDCTSNTATPGNGAPACSCNPNFWPTGCTLRKCQPGDAGQYYYCECTKEYSPDFCLKPSCSKF